MKDNSQKFCQLCGTPIESKISTDMSPTNNLSQASTINSSSKVIPHYSNQIKSEGLDSHSKKSLIFGIISLIVILIAFNIGAYALANPLMPYTMDTEIYYLISPIVYISIPLNLGIHITGLIFGIVGKRQINKVISENGVTKAGNIISLLGIVVNSIGLVLIIIFGPIMFSSLLNITST